jgi:uncharacterized membrane protein (UPF0127 family)
MEYMRHAILALLSLVVLAGCQQPVLVTVQVDNINARVEVADSEQERQRGLMFRDAMEKDQGMLLVFESEKPLTMWMLNTYIPLDVGFFDARGQLLNVVTMQPDGGKTMHHSEGPALYALEMNAGWFDHYRIESGARLKLPEW